MKAEKKFLTFHFDTKEMSIDEERNVAVIKGYAATFDLDRGADIIAKGAFDKTLADHKKRKRQIRMLWQHNSNELIGGYPPEKAYVDSNGLFVEGEINLDTRRGKEAYALAKQGVLCDFSIGYRVHDSEYQTIKGIPVRLIKELELFEVSPVGEPMNPKAQITDVKSNSQFQDLPLAQREQAWDAEAALARVKSFLESDEEPGESFHKAFLWSDDKNAEDFDGYKMLIADVIEGKLTAVPRAIFAATATASKTIATIPEEDREAVMASIDSYYSKMDLESPFRKSSVRVDDLSTLTERDLEKLLKSGVCFTNQTSKRLASALKTFLRDEEMSGNRDDSTGAAFVDELKSLAERMNTLTSQFEGK